MNPASDIVWPLACILAVLVGGTFAELQSQEATTGAKPGYVQDVTKQIVPLPWIEEDRPSPPYAVFSDDGTKLLLTWLATRRGAGPCVCELELPSLHLKRILVSTPKIDEHVPLYQGARAEGYAGDDKIVLAVNMLGFQCADLFLYCPADGSFRNLTKTDDQHETFLQFLPEKNRILFMTRPFDPQTCHYGGGWGPSVYLDVGTGKKTPVRTLGDLPKLCGEQAARLTEIYRKLQDCGTREAPEGLLEKLIRFSAVHRVLDRESYRERCDYRGLTYNVSLDVAIYPMPYTKYFVVSSRRFGCLLRNLDGDIEMKLHDYHALAVDTKHRKMLLRSPEPERNQMPGYRHLLFDIDAYLKHVTASFPPKDRQED